MIEKAEVEAQRQKLPLRVMFQDEARFGRINKIRKCWAPLGTRPEVPAQIIREYTYAYGAVSPKDGIFDTLILPFMDSVCMNIFLEEISKRHKNEYILMICDGAPCHSEGVLQIPHNMSIEKLPPYCPQLNPVENIWDEIREKFFKNYAFDSMDAVEDKLIKACRYLENNPCITKSISSFPWIIVD